MNFTYDKSIFSEPETSDVSRVAFRLKKILPEFVFDTVKLEGNPFTFPEVKTLLDGITVGGHKLSDQEQILNQRESYVRMIKEVESGRFSTDLDTWVRYNAILARGEALKVGQLRDGNVSIAGTAYSPPDWRTLSGLFASEREDIESINNPVERAYAFSASAALNRFFYDGNKRTGRLVMNGVLLSHGLDGVSIPAGRQLEYNTACLKLYDQRDATDLFSMMLTRHKEVGLGCKG